MSAHAGGAAAAARQHEPQLGRCGRLPYLPAWAVHEPDQLLVNPSSITLCPLILLPMPAVCPDDSAAHAIPCSCLRLSAVGIVRARNCQLRDAPRDQSSGVFGLPQPLQNVADALFVCRNTQSSAVNSAAPVLGTSPGASFPAGTSPSGRPRRGHAYSPGSQQPSKWFVQVS